MSLINAYRGGVAIVIGNRTRLMVAVIMTRLRMTMVRLLVALQWGLNSNSNVSNQSIPRRSRYRHRQPHEAHGGHDHDQA